jgi:hypothetical protein
MVHRCKHGHYGILAQRRHDRLSVNVCIESITWSQTPRVVDALAITRDLLANSGQPALSCNSDLLTIPFLQPTNKQALISSNMQQTAWSGPIGLSMMTSTCTPALTGLPREIRDQIYSYIVPIEAEKTYVSAKFDASKKSKHYDSSNKCIFDLGMFMAGARRRESLCPEYVELLPLLKTNRQLSLELLPIWFEHNVVSLKDDSMQLHNTIAWFGAIAPARLQLVKEVLVRVSIRPVMGDALATQDILTWLKLEEDVLPKGIKVAFMIDRHKVSEIWLQAYSIAKRCRKCGMPWKEVETCMKDMQRMLMTLGWATSSPETSEDEEEDSDWRG